MCKNAWLFVLVPLIIVSLFSCRKHTVSNVITRPDPQGPGPGPGEEPGPNDPVYTQLAKNVSIGSNSGGFYEALPPDYDSSSKHHPLLVFLHGGGELGNGQSDLPQIARNAVTRR